MPGSFDLEVDTEQIRRAAATLDEAARQFAASPDACPPAAAAGSLGESAQAVSVLGLVNLRCAQARDAANQLSSITVGLAAKLRFAADAFERSEAAHAPGGR